MTYKGCPPTHLDPHLAADHQRSTLVLILPPITQQPSSYLTCKEPPTVLTTTMSAPTPSLKRCPRSHCKSRLDSDATVRSHIIDAHGKDPERMVCGGYTIKSYYYRQKHAKECRQCRSGAPAAETVVPSIESDADSDDASITGADPRDGEAEQAFRNRKVVFNGPNYGVIYVTVEVCSRSPSCTSDPN
ncbi:uncharacterized protein LY79DRAFT_111236 [Colletotrichum navitas]|uniref:Uncharacterized protein n=1 Tax=Colletotrichum navitas TaxID=681940 RepID=A0AAD8V5T6_9PEZI|nr:uncharacterized protein LY79DRAFT_111236 [Colletotrichum navitas]KAK1595337.1 hypothetical protein LY79DRAFT_111236 [Colletotrichum navitas]